MLQTPEVGALMSECLSALIPNCLMPDIVCLILMPSCLIALLPYCLIILHQIISTPTTPKDRHT